MKNNQGITMITLVITIIVIVLIASITIYNGIDTINSARRKNATDITNAVYLALVANEDEFQTGKTLTDNDFKMLGLDYTSGDYNISFTREDDTVNNRINYTIHFIDKYNNEHEANYSYYKELSKITTKAEYDAVKKVNRPVLNINGMKPKSYTGEDVFNVYNESWYNYQKGVSKLAIMEYNNILYAWIPRFAYKVQNFYFGKSYDIVPSTALDIVFLRNDTSYMENGETLADGYAVHPAFASGESGFWVMVDCSRSGNNVATVNGISNAINNTSFTSNGVESHLMKNSEYAAAVLLSKYLENDEIIFNVNAKEYVAGFFNTGNGTNKPNDNFDEYSINSSETNYYLKVQGHAMADTPWNVRLDISEFEENSNRNYLARDVKNGGEFYYEPVTANITATYRMVIPE